MRKEDLCEGDKENKSFITPLLCVDDLKNIIVFLPFDNVFQMKLIAFVLNMKPPTGDFVDVRPIDGLFDACDFMQSRFGKRSRSMRFLIFQFR